VRFATLMAAIIAAASPAPTLAQEATFDANGVPIHYVQAGRGEPIVLIHGNGGSIDNWVSTGVFANLAKDYRVIALDCRGFGQSGKPHTPSAYGAEMALDIVRLLDHLEIPKAHIVGYSMGAHITALLLTTHPDRFLTATLGGAVGRQPNEADFDLAERAAAEWEQGRPGPALYEFSLRTLPAEQPRPSPDSIRRRQEATLRNPNFDRLAQAAFLRSFRAQSVAPALAAAVTVPTLAIVGSADPNAATARIAKTQRPAMKLVVIDSATHSGTRGVIGRPEFVAAIREFLASTRPR